MRCSGALQAEIAPNGEHVGGTHPKVELRQMARGKISRNLEWRRVRTIPKRAGADPTVD